MSGWRTSLQFKAVPIHPPAPLLLPWLLSNINPPSNITWQAAGYSAGLMQQPLQSWSMWPKPSANSRQSSIFLHIDPLPHILRECSLVAAHQLISYPTHITKRANQDRVWICMLGNSSFTQRSENWVQLWLWIIIQHRCNRGLLLPSSFVCLLEYSKHWEHIWSRKMSLTVTPVKSLHLPYFSCWWWKGLFCATLNSFCLLNGVRQLITFALSHRFTPQSAEFQELVFTQHI